MLKPLHSHKPATSITFIPSERPDLVEQLSKITFDPNDALYKNYINLRIKYLGKIDKIIALLKNQNIFLKFENEEWNLKII